MKEKKNFKRLVIFTIAAMMCLSVLIIMPTSMAASAGENEINLLNSPPTPPSGRNSVDRDNIPKSVVILTAPTSEWTYGCTATSAGMLFGYYDRNGYANMYTGPTNGGVCPLTDLGQGVPGNLRYPITPSTYIIATENTLDGITQRAHVGDYWIGPSGTAGPDPWVTNVWTEHTWGKCTADYLGTNQWKWDYNPSPNDGIVDSNKDGSTIYWTSGTPGAKLIDWAPTMADGWWTCDPNQGPGYIPASGTSCCVGCRLFAESRGYTVITNYNQKTDTPQGTGTPGFGFTFADYKSEIDAGRPVLTHWTSTSGGHTMLGVGYDDTNPSNSIIYFHDTWDNLLHWISWTGTYSSYNFELKAVTVIHLAPCDEVPPTTIKTINDPKYGPNDEWVTSFTEFNLTASDDGVGVNHTYYRIWYNGLWTPWMEYTGNFTLSGECKHYVEYFSTDYIGNVEEVHNQTHYVDDTSPTTTKTYGDPYYTDGVDEWVTSLTPITLDATDGGLCPSGVKEIVYNIGAGWNFVSGASVTFYIPVECTHLIQYYSTDNLGNTEAINSQLVKVDNTHPTTTKTYGIPYGTDGVDEWITPETPITLDAVDGGMCPCGVMEIWYNYGAGWNVVPGDTATFTIPGECTHLIEYYSVDTLGNVESVKSQTVKVDNSTADAGGPYTAASHEAVQFDSSDSHVSPCCVPATYLWEFGDGQTSTEQNPTHTYYAEEGTFTVTSTIITQCFSHTDTTTVTISDNDPPIVQLEYPRGGEELSGTIVIKWFALDAEDQGSPSIDLCYSGDGGSSWNLIASGLENTIGPGDHFDRGEYSWSAGSLPDGNYMVRIYAYDTAGNVAKDTSKPFMVGTTTGTGILVSYVNIEASNNYLKNGDSLEIRAGITFGQHISADYVTADLSGLGKGTSVPADSFDGLTAIWVIDDVVCTPSDGPITITVTATDGATTGSNTATITADNTLPELTVIKPENALYFFNAKLFATNKPIIIGAITLEATIYDTSGIQKTEIYIDDELKETLPGDSQWYMNLRLMGRHILKIVAYDNAGNTNVHSQAVIIINPFGDK